MGLLDLGNKLKELFGNAQSTWNNAVQQTQQQPRQQIGQTLQQLAPQWQNNVQQAVQNYKPPTIGWGQPMQTTPQVQFTPQGQNLVNNFNQWRTTPIQYKSPVLPLLQQAGQQLQKIPDVSSKMVSSFTPLPNIDMKVFGQDYNPAKFFGQQISEIPRSAGRSLERLGQGNFAKGGVGNAVEDYGNLLQVLPVGQLLSKGKYIKELEPVVNFLRNRVTSEDTNLLGKFVAQVEKNPNKNMDYMGQQVASFAKSVFGSQAETWSNKQLASNINYVLQRIGQGKNSAGLGLSIRDVSKGLAKPGSKPLFPTQPLAGEAGVKNVKIPTQPLESKLPLQSQSQLGSSPLGEVYHAEPNPAKIIGIKSKAQEQIAKADFAQWQKQVFQQENIQTTSKAINQVVGAIKTGTTSPLSKDVSQLKDISGFTAQGRDVYRNFKAVFGNKFEEAKRVLLDPFDQAKGANVDMQKTWLGNLKTNIVDKLGIKPGSKESELTQLFGEKQITLDELKAQAPQSWQKIVEADTWFRNSYNNLLDEVNKARQAIYPNNPGKIIPKRNDYYRHFRDMQEGLGGLKNIFESPSGITSSLSGISEYVKPKSKFLSFAQKRLGMKSEIDAVGGFLDYIKSASYARNIDPQIEKFRALADELATATTEGPQAGKLNNFIEFLQDYANDLSGKSNPADRFVQKIIGRKAFSAINWLNNRVKANTILGNASSSIAQIFNVPQGIASAGPVNSLKGMGKSLASIFTENKPMQQSVFLKERYFRGYDQFNTGILNDTKKFAGWMVGALDDVGSRFIWNAHYEKAIAEGIVNPVKYADDLTRQMVAGRGVGEVPLIQKAKLFQLVAPFQLEVGNLWYVMKDMVDQKQFGKLATLFVANYVFNKGAEQIRGSGVTFDPIQAMIDAGGTYMQEEDKKTGAIKVTGRLAGEVLGNVPLLQSTATLYPEYGNKDMGLPTRKEFFGKEDPTRFGSGLMATKALSDPLYKIVPPFAGGQIKKTVEGIQSFAKGYLGPDNAIKTPVDQSPGNAVKSALFGQYSTPEAQAYFNNNQRPLSEDQSAIYKAGATGILNDTLTSRKVEQEKAALKSGETPKGQTQQVTLGVYQLSDGTFTTKVGKSWNTFDTPEEAQLAIDKDTFKSSGKNIQTIGDNVFRLSKGGEITTTPKIDYETSLNTQKMENAKLGDDFKTWMSLAEKQYNNLQEQLQDPTLDELEQVELQQKIDALVTSVAKYKGYGGFTKGKAPKKVALKKLTFKATKPSVIKFSSPKFSTLKTKKAPKPKIVKNKVTKINLKSAVKAIVVKKHATNVLG